MIIPKEKMVMVDNQGRGKGNTMQRLMQNPIKISFGIYQSGISKSIGIQSIHLLNLYEIQKKVSLR